MFGLGDTKIDLKLNRFNFKPGETIEGTIALTVKKPVKAKGVIVTLYAEQKQVGMASRGGISQQSAGKVFELAQTVDGEKEYSTGENPAVYPFKINIPANALQIDNPLEGGLGTALKAAQFFTGGMKQTQWFLEAKLDVPMGLDIKKRIQINIS